MKCFRLIQPGNARAVIGSRCEVGDGVDVDVHVEARVHASVNVELDLERRRVIGDEISLAISTSEATAGSPQTSNLRRSRARPPHTAREPEIGCRLRCARCC